MNLKITKTLSASLMVLITASCAQDGFDDKERFSGGVTNAQLESPQITPESFSTLTNPDGSESVKVTWPVVMGSGGYLCNVSIVDDPSNPVKLITDSVVDGCALTFEKKEDTNYEVIVKTLGNSKYNNTEAKEPTLYAYSTLVPATIVPAGEELSNYINSYLANNQGGDSNELGFELEAGATYTLDGTINFDLNTVTFRGNKADRPTVVLGENGSLSTQGGLKIKFINFDCSSSNKTGLLELSKEPSATISTEALGYKADGANQNGFVINDPVMFQDCNIKGLKNSLLFGNKKNWSLRDFRIMNCIVQLNNSGSNPVIHLQGASNGLIKDMTIKNSTFYNLVKNSSAYFIRYSNSSNAQPKKIFGNGDNSSTHIISHCTFAKTFSNKDFANNMPNTNTLKTTVEYCILYDVFRLYQYIQSQAYMLTPGNTIFGVDGGNPNNNDIGGRKDKLGNPYATLEDPEFEGPFLQEFDLSQPKGGVNFRPTAPIATQNQSGDPRWYE